MTSLTARWSRLAVGAAVLATTALFAPATTAHAAETQPDLFVSFTREPVAEIDTLGTTIGMYAYNHGAGDATGVTVTFDLGDLAERVAATVPDRLRDTCEIDGDNVTCAVGALNAGQVTTIRPLTLTSRQGATPGDAGSVTVTIAGAEDDANPDNNTTTFPVTILASGPDLVAAAQDVNDASSRLGAGDTAPLYTGVLNEGDSPATDFTIDINLRTGTTFVERYSDCTYTDYYPNDVGLPYVYGPSSVTCVLPLTLEPGEGLLLFDDETGESLFNLTFGRNLPGPAEHYGSFSVALAGEARAAKKVASSKGSGPSFADAVRALHDKATRAGAARQAVVERELDESDNYADFRLWTKANHLDVAVTAPAVKGKVGETVDLTYEVVNNGPSDGGGPGVSITAPSGTVLLPAEWCHTEGGQGGTLPESEKLRCNFESEFPSVASGYGRIKATVQIKIKSTPGTDGTIVVDGGRTITESKPENNTARIVIDTGDGGSGGGDGGAGGGLPVTGAPAAALAGVGAAVLALGGVLFVLFRRRRVAFQTPRD
ncbi:MULTISPECIES: LPXTG cell wall anchor domain-containing protein [unclassified Micromonospora]|uniref:LPXTG cell wall anchor domain-containing protein n=1 Tax=unclassified Micromonospora TaxID=2617518 RepID=UPI0022B60F5C|nr:MULTISPECIES: LPXTG cell wall anchor domain-containing protein [unclassified Micromonospora]MCZ7419859.1 LPXTG cell wall anchor domain-containing protein [Verrucosispora sp. WMMA2121]WBB89593.1 LPXTG cell wall anchor domain-containing protein [Verrucosispora sp. WMMC514]